jgi:hypothetical protein
VTRTASMSMCMQRHGPVPIERTEETRARPNSNTSPLCAAGFQRPLPSSPVLRFALPASHPQQTSLLDAHADTINTTHHTIPHYCPGTRLHVSSILQSALDRPTRG